ncbi:MAG TPA: tetratricopeptide repeat protein [Candidatus Udaeobacter sp.]|nr:tetratricopeptide repeat protein [Candidatus Udaeobacter sp.]
MNPRNFFGELKRRNVYKVAIAYAVVAWLLMQVASQIFPFFEIPNWAVRFVVLAIIIGFPIALILAWAFELTPEGIKRTEDVDASKSIRHKTGRKLDFFIIAVLLLVISILLFQRLHPNVSPAVSPSLEKSIAVLPFENFSEDKAFAFFADGVQDEILTDLAKIADLKVISRTSVMQYKNVSTRNLPEIAQALKVAHVLEGSVQRSGSRVRVSAQLIDARNDTHVWVEKYDRDLADVFAIQSEIAQKIADQLQAKLSLKEKAAMAERPTSDLAAYDLYLRAKELFYEVTSSREKEDYLKAVQLLDQAVARDPTFLLAYCLLARVHDNIFFSNYDPTETRLALAENSVKATVRLQPDSGETHLAHAIHFYWGYRNYDRAREELAKAQRTLPNNAQIFQFLGLIDRRQGRWDEAVENLERAVDLDPRNQDMLNDLKDTYFNLHRQEEPIALAYRALSLQPRSAWLRAGPAWMGVEADANIAPLRATLNTIEAEGPASAAEVANISFRTALRERDPVAAARALANISSEAYMREADYRVPHGWYEGLLAKLRQDAPAAHAAFMAARAETEKVVRAQPGNAEPLTALGLIDAELGDKERAIREGRTACGMLPPAKDAISGVLLASSLARIYALTGEKDLALEQLDVVSKLPSGPTYGELRLDPEWDSLRGDSRFEKIVASLAPKKGSP